MQKHFIFIISLSLTHLDELIKKYINIMVLQFKRKFLLNGCFAVGRKIEETYVQEFEYNVSPNRFFY